MFKVRATIPDKIEPERFRESFAYMASETATDVRDDFALTAENFETEPKFNKRGQIRGNAITISVTTNDVNYLRLNKGVKGGYKIPKAGPGIMVFQPGYKAKTDPERLATGRLPPTEGGKFGDPIFFYGQITAKGFPGRRFDAAIKKLWEPEIARRLQLAMSVPFGSHLAVSPSLMRRIRSFRNSRNYTFERGHFDIRTI